LLFQKDDSKYDFSLLNITIFKNDFLVDVDSFSMDESLNILSRENISKSHIYRVVINLAYDWENINNEYIIYGLTQSDYLDYIIIRNANMLKKRNYITIHEKGSGMTDEGFKVNDYDTIITEGDPHGTNGTFRVGRFIIRPIKFIN
jgi:hypothetical protein